MHASSHISVIVRWRMLGRLSIQMLRLKLFGTSTQIEHSLPPEDTIKTLLRFDGGEDSIDYLDGQQ